MRKASMCAILMLVGCGDQAATNNATRHPGLVRPTPNATSATGLVIDALKSTANDTDGFEVVGCDEEAGSHVWRYVEYSGTLVPIRWRERNKIGARQLHERTFFVFSAEDAKKIQPPSSWFGLSNRIVGTRQLNYDQCSGVLWTEELEKRAERHENDSQNTKPATPRPPDPRRISKD